MHAVFESVFYKSDENERCNLQAVINLFGENCFQLEPLGGPQLFQPNVIPDERQLLVQRHERIRGFV
ncbi:hypothetical protein D3C87_1783420 [compost metagenome]